MKKLSFFEMECVSLQEIAEFEAELNDCGCRFVSDKSMMDDHIAESYSCFGEFEGTQYDDEELLLDTSFHGYNSLREKFEEKFSDNAEDVDLIDSLLQKFTAKYENISIDRETCVFYLATLGDLTEINESHVDGLYDWVQEMM